MPESRSAAGSTDPHAPDATLLPVTEDRFAEALANVVFPGVDDGALRRARDVLPTLDSLGDLPPASSVLVRTDLDMAIVDGEAVEVSRVRSALETIEFCMDHGFRVILFGHLGRNGASLAPVQRAFARELDRDVVLVESWVDEESLQLSSSAVAQISECAAPGVVMLDNTRKYALEQSLWTVDREEFPQIAAAHYRLASDIRTHLAQTFINEGIAASNLDFSSCAVPLLMDRVALGRFVRAELDHLVEAQASEIIIMCGLKPNKLDDLEDIVRRGRVRLIVVAGALAMSLRKADARLHGHDVSIGRAESESDAPFYVPEARIEQAQRILMECQEQGVRLVLPVDFVLEDGEVADVIPPDGAQQDIGPKTVELIDQALSSAVASHGAAASLRLYFNGVPGRFEDPCFRSGSEQLIALIRRMTLEGVDTYVGGERVGRRS